MPTTQKAHQAALAAGWGGESIEQQLGEIQRCVSVARRGGGCEFEAALAEAVVRIAALCGEMNLALGSAMVEQLEAMHEH